MKQPINCLKCDKPATTRHLCAVHYNAELKAGRHTEFKPLKGGALIDRFLRKVNMHDGDCWIWEGGLHDSGYGLIQSDVDKTKSLRAHRVSYELFIGDIPDGLVVCHKCDNRRCVNPSHLFVGTRADNNKDKHTKKRHTHGEKQPNSKLTAQDVIDIRASALSTEELSKHYGVCTNHIRVIKRRLQWTHIK